MDKELLRNTSVSYNSCESSRPSVVHKRIYEREFSTRIQDGHSNGVYLTTTSAFTPFYRCSHKLTGPSRLSCFDFQHLHEEQPLVLSGGRPFHLASSYLVDPHEPTAQKFMGLQQFSALFPGTCQPNGNLRCSSIREDGFTGLCCQENHGEGDEDYQMNFGRGKHRTMPYLSPDQKIQEPDLPGQRLGVRLYCQPPEGATSDFSDELEVSPRSNARESYGMRSREMQEGNIQEEKEEQEEHLKECSYKEEPQNAKYCARLSGGEISAGSFDAEDHGSEDVYACLSSINHDQTQNETNDHGLSERSRSHGPRRCQKICCRAHMHCHGSMPQNTDNEKSEMKNRAEHRTPNPQGGTKCLVCYKTLKRSYYMKSHMLIHTGEKPYKCTYCTKSFNQIGNRNAHQRIHTGEKPYTCDYCGKRFIFNSSKNNHMKTHRPTSFLFPGPEDES